MSRKLPGLRTAFIAYLLILVLGLGGPAAHALWSQRGTVTVDVTAGHWTLPTVTLAGPGTTVRGTVALTAEAGDTETGIRTVAIQHQAPGGTWTTLCTTATAPYTCQWNTVGLPDGAYGLRAVATANSGLTTTSATIQTTVANTFSINLAVPGEVVRGTVDLAATLNSPGGTAYTVRVEYSLEGANKWNTLCQMPSAPYKCTWMTDAAAGSFANDYYDLRAVAVSGGTSTYSETVTDVLVDNQAPMVKMIDPGTPLRGTNTFTATASDTHSGIEKVQLQYSRTGTGTWTTFCAPTEEPYACRFNTISLPSDSYGFRAIATDQAGNSTTSNPVANRLVDNTVSSVSMEDPGAYLSGDATLTAAANSTAGIGTVRIQSSPTGTNTWTTRCTLTSAPYTCDWDTRTTDAGLYNFRAVLTDGAGKETISTPVTDRRVDNTPLRAADVQATNGGKEGKLDAGDALAFTYNQQVDLATVTPGWDGVSLPVTLRLRDGNNEDTVDILRPGSTVNLGSVNTKGNFIKNGKTVNFNATMTATTITTAGVPKTVVTVTLGAPTGASGLLLISRTDAKMVWTPLSSVTSIAGVPSSLASATETGTLDRDF